MSNLVPSSTIKKKDRTFYFQRLKDKVYYPEELIVSRDSSGLIRRAKGSRLHSSKSNHQITSVSGSCQNREGIHGPKRHFTVPLKHSQPRRLKIPNSQSARLEKMDKRYRPMEKNQDRRPADPEILKDYENSNASLAHQQSRPIVASVRNALQENRYQGAGGARKQCPLSNMMNSVAEPPQRYKSNDTSLDETNPLGEQTAQKPKEVQAPTVPMNENTRRIVENQRSHPTTTRNKGVAKPRAEASPYWGVINGEIQENLQELPCGERDLLDVDSFQYKEAQQTSDDDTKCMAQGQYEMIETSKGTALPDSFWATELPELATLIADTAEHWQDNEPVHPTKDEEKNVTKTPYDSVSSTNPNTFMIKATESIQDVHGQAQEGAHHPSCSTLDYRMKTAENDQMMSGNLFLMINL